MDNLNVLVEAKKEYLGQLCHLMTPVMIQVFQDMYDEATKLSKGRKVLIMFQKLLKEVPNWSNAMSKSHSDNITERCSWFSDLLAAVFVACTKILSAVRLKADNKKISLKLPTNEVFIQTVYNNAAKNLYKDPYVYHEEQSEYLRDEKLTARFCVCIEESIKELIPVQQILQTYMSQESKDIDIGETDDPEDPDIFDEPEPEPEPEPPSPKRCQRNKNPWPKPKVNRPWKTLHQSKTLRDPWDLPLIMNLRRLIMSRIRTQHPKPVTKVSFLVTLQNSEQKKLAIIKWNSPTICETPYGRRSSVGSSPRSTFTPRLN
jgi:hypothetical protein